jgi:hypothetical protein
MKVDIWVGMQKVILSNGGALPSFKFPLTELIKDLTGMSVGLCSGHDLGFSSLAHSWRTHKKKAPGQDALTYSKNW